MTPGAEHSRKRTRQRVALVMLMLAALVVLSVLLEHVWEGHLSTILNMVREAGPLAPLVYVCVAALASLVFIPQVPLTLLSGVLFGALWGAAWSLAAMAVSGSAAFWLSRHVLRHRLLDRVGEHPSYRKLESLSRSHPAKVVAVSRIVPVMPYPWLSYLLGLTRVRYLTFVFMSFVCMIPETLLLTAGGHILRDGVAHGRLGVREVAILLAAAAVLFLVVRWGKRMVGSGAEE